MRRTLLEVTKDILSALDSEDVNTLSDTVEAQQIAETLESVYYGVVVPRSVPEHSQLLTLTSLADTATPTHFTYDSSSTGQTLETARLECVRYDVGEGVNVEYREIKFIEPLMFLNLNNYNNTNVQTVLDVVGSTKLAIGNDKAPAYYTSFDDEHIVMDSFKNTVDDHLQTSKTQAFGVVVPDFDRTDDFEIDLDATLFSYYLAEAKSMCFELLKGGAPAKVEQSARRLKTRTQSDAFRTQRTASNRPYYGRLK